MFGHMDIFVFWSNTSGICLFTFDVKSEEASGVTLQSWAAQNKPGLHSFSLSLKHYFNYIIILSFYLNLIVPSVEVPAGVGAYM